MPARSAAYGSTTGTPLELVYTAPSVLFKTCAEGILEGEDGGGRESGEDDEIYEGQRNHFQVPLRTMLRFCRAGQPDGKRVQALISARCLELRMPHTKDEKGVWGFPREGPLNLHVSRKWTREPVLSWGINPNAIVRRFSRLYINAPG